MARIRNNLPSNSNTSVSQNTPIPVQEPQETNMEPQDASMEPAEPSGPPQRPTSEVASPQMAYDIVDSKGVRAHLSQINLGIPKLVLAYFASG
ncbi:hypothetical protein HMI56_006169 [Coelomomyces lativittatus]|nr:hypothetical protein HMI56_006169 [Coelomomyces lativittatus]